MARENQLDILKRVLDTTPDSFLIFNEKGRCLYGNVACRQLFGYSSQEMERVSAEDLLPALFPQQDSEWGTGEWLKSMDDETLGMTSEGMLIPVRVFASNIKTHSPRYYAFYIQNISTEKESEEFMLQLEYLDTITGLANRRLFVEKLNATLRTSQEEGGAFGLMQIGLDRFKYINDSFGYGFGDLLLYAVGRRIQDCVQPRDIVAYLGGDEFALLLSTGSTEESTLAIAQDIQQRMQSPFYIEGKEIYLTCSIGVALYPVAGETEDTLRKNLHSALHLAKNAGRNSVQIYSPALALHAKKMLRMHADMHKALENEEFLLYYQPLVELKTNKIKGMEALIRWKHPEKGMVSPGEFIGLAEDNGLILDIGKWVMWAACEQTKQWIDMGFSLRVSVNASLKQLLEPDFVEEVLCTLEETRLPPAALDIEITESLAMEQFDTVVLKLQALRELGIRVSLDDFGAGYSSLNYLTTLPLTKVKLDRGLVQFTHGEQKEARLVNSIIQMAHQLNLEVVAEGIETQEQLDILKAQGCDTIQGYYYSKPLPAKAFEQLLWAQPWNLRALAA